MRPDSDRWVEITPSAHPHERTGLELVRGLLPEGFDVEHIRHVAGALEKDPVPCTAFRKMLRRGNPVRFVEIQRLSMQLDGASNHTPRQRRIPSIAQSIRYLQNLRYRAIPPLTLK